METATVHNPKELDLADKPDPIPPLPGTKSVFIADEDQPELPKGNQSKDDTIPTPGTTVVFVDKIPADEIPAPTTHTIQNGEGEPDPAPNPPGTRVVYFGNGSLDLNLSHTVAAGTSRNAMIRQARSARAAGRRYSLPAVGRGGSKKSAR